MPPGTNTWRKHLSLRIPIIQAMPFLTAITGQEVWDHKVTHHQVQEQFLSCIYQVLKSARIQTQQWKSIEVCTTIAILCTFSFFLPHNIGQYRNGPFSPNVCAKHDADQVLSVCTWSISLYSLHIHVPMQKSLKCRRAHSLCYTFYILWFSVQLLSSP